MQIQSGNSPQRGFALPVVANASDAHANSTLPTSSCEPIDVRNQRLLGFADAPQRLAIADQTLRDALSVLNDTFTRTGSIEAALERVLQGSGAGNSRSTCTRRSAGPAESITSSRPPTHWLRLILHEAVQRPPAVVMKRYITNCGDHDATRFTSIHDEDYAVKGGKRQACSGEMLFAEQVAGHLGKALGAPVSDVALAIVPHEVLETVPVHRSAFPTPTHASRWIPDCASAQDEANGGAWQTSGYAGKSSEAMANLPQNANRLASFIVLTNWLGIIDQQLLLQKGSNLIYSVDHGCVIHNCKPQQPGTITANEKTSSFWCDDRQALLRAVDRLHGISDHTIAHAIAAAPFDWGASLAQRVVYAQHLAALRDNLSVSVHGSVETKHAQRVGSR